MYDYKDEMRTDILDAIDEKVSFEGKPLHELYEDKEEAYEKVYDDLWIDDSVTGNASGSYFFNTYKAEEALAHNLDLLAEALDEFGLETDAVKYGAEWCDVTIRCYLLSEVLGEVLEDVYRYR